MCQQPRNTQIISIKHPDGATALTRATEVQTVSVYAKRLLHEFVVDATAAVTVVAATVLTMVAEAAAEAAAAPVAELATVAVQARPAA